MIISHGNIIDLQEENYLSIVDKMGDLNDCVLYSEVSYLVNGVSCKSWHNKYGYQLTYNVHTSVHIAYTHPYIHGYAFMDLHPTACYPWVDLRVHISIGTLMHTCTFIHGYTHVYGHQWVHIHAPATCVSMDTHTWHAHTTCINMGSHAPTTCIHG